MMNFKKIPLLTLLCCSITMGAGSLAFCALSPQYDYYPNGLANATGHVVATGLNYIDIQDEDQQRVRRFVYLDREHHFHQGDYIRIYYHPRGAIVQAIKRITILKFDPHSQNLGNIFHQESPS